MRFSTSMQDSQTTALRSLNERPGESGEVLREGRGRHLHKARQTESEVEVMELSAGTDIAARACITELEHPIKNIDLPCTHFRAQGGASVSSRGPTSTASATNVRRSTTTSSSWGRALQEVAKHARLEGCKVICPYTLSSVLFAPCPGSMSARNFVAQIRRLKLKARASGTRYGIWATIQKQRPGPPLDEDHGVSPEVPRAVHPPVRDLEVRLLAHRDRWQGEATLQRGPHREERLRAELLGAVVRRQDIQVSSVGRVGRGLRDHEGGPGRRPALTVRGGQFHFFTQSARCKPLRDMQLLLDPWETTARLDAISFKEMFGDDGKSDSFAPRVVRHIGRRRHMMIYGPPRRVAAA